MRVNFSGCRLRVGGISVPSNRCPDSGPDVTNASIASVRPTQAGSGSSL